MTALWTVEIRYQAADGTNRRTVAYAAASSSAAAVDLAIAALQGHCAPLGIYSSQARQVPAGVFFPRLPV